MTVNKHGYRQPPNESTIEGIDILIDENTHKLCEAYNQTSGATRGVLYLLLIVTAISVIAVFNNNWKYNWDSDRMTMLKDSIIIYQSQIENIKKSINPKYVSQYADKLQDNKIVKGQTSSDKFITLDTAKLFKKLDTLNINLKINQKYLDGYIAADIENNASVKVPIIGVTIDVNDLASISGITLIILLIVLRFTITREKHNLKIAFNSINERYNSSADYLKLKKDYKENVLSLKSSDDFEDEISKQKWNDLYNGDSKKEWNKFIADVNFTRRRYHYNYLSMNEIFHLPLLDTNKNEVEESWFENQIKTFVNIYLFYFFCFIYSYIVFNDFCSIKNAWFENYKHTIVIETISVICFFAIFNLCRDCVEHKKIVNSLFNNFWKDDYKYDYGDYSINRLPLIKVFGIPVILIVVLILLSLLIQLI